MPGRVVFSTKLRADVRTFGFVASKLGLQVSARSGTVKLRSRQCGEYDPCLTKTFLDQVATALGELRGNNWD